MKKNKKRFSPAEISGIIFLLLAAAVFSLNPTVAAIILSLYVFLCLLGCFFPQTNFLFNVINRGNTGNNFVALTFDDGPSEPVTRQILALLNKHAVKATFFISGTNALRNPEIIREIVAQGHAIGNHSYSHNPLLMLKSYRKLYMEIAETQKILQEEGINTIAFRPPVGIVNPKLPKVLNELGMLCVTFSCRAFDAGNFFVKNISKKILNKIRENDIVLLHDVPVRRHNDCDAFLVEIENIIIGIGKKGFLIVPLSVLINKEIMIK